MTLAVVDLSDIGGRPPREPGTDGVGSVVEAPGEAGGVRLVNRELLPSAE
ncbi:hypothetical protein [Streptomyces sp. SHP 1-2]|nr:hypothetical protein [Streptomyces sp. SHP 1-2]